MARHNVISTHISLFILNFTIIRLARVILQRSNANSNWHKNFYSNAHLKRYNVVTINFNDKCVFWRDNILPLNEVENDEKEQKQVDGACVLVWLCARRFSKLSFPYFHLFWINEIYIYTFTQTYFEKQLRFKHE